MAATRFSDMKYRNTFYGFPLTVLCIKEVINENFVQFLHVKGIFKLKNSCMSSNYIIYKRYVDFNLDKSLNILLELDKKRENKRSVSLVC